MDTEIVDDVAGDVRWRALRPSGAGAGLPLIVLLHGAFSSADLVTRIRPLVDRLLDRGELAPAVVACASTPTVGGFYLGGWETFVAQTFPDVLHRRLGTDLERVALLGASMGGYGALKIAFASPHRWRAVAAVSPALLDDEPGPRNTIGVLGELRDAMAAAGWEHSSVRHRLRGNADSIRRSGLKIMLRCGDRDVFALHDGTERLHRELWDLDVAHDYHLVRDADHDEPEATAAMRAALTFVAAALHDEPGAVRGDAPGGLRALLAPDLAEAVRRDPDTSRRYGRM
ncbi:alpha/beta hydrolase [Catenuloplanes indicus]|uniref:S-formylglutathione hydrolase n=1 Tax=Catenuloplanes indicus TaxID=137267 RepID=A0AAE3W5E9_9ACTN|nr:alpha/beta hydrolase-fold protein [Catenuloplanes indicus]MDQ0370303.1 S-formylglutathione hydrolase [Catenuloplanes indicus]